MEPPTRSSALHHLSDIMPALIARARRVEAVLSLNSNVFSERLLEVLERRLKAGVGIRCLLIHDYIGWDRRVVRRVHVLAQGFPRTFYAKPAGVASEEMFSRYAIQRNGRCIALIPVLGISSHFRPSC